MPQKRVGPLNPGQQDSLRQLRDFVRSQEDVLDRIRKARGTEVDDRKAEAEVAALPLAKDKLHHELFLVNVNGILDGGFAGLLENVRSTSRKCLVAIAGDFRVDVPAGTHVCVVEEDGGTFLAIG